MPTPALLLTLALAFAPPDTGGPRLEFISAHLNEGPGREPPAGRKPPPRELAGSLRVKGLTITARNLRITVLPPAGQGRPLRLRAHRCAVAGPQAPGEVHWVARWPKPATPEGWNVRLEVRQRGRTYTATGPIRVNFLAAPPRDRSQEQH